MLKVIRYMDMYKTEMDDDGNMYSTVFKKDLTVPVFVESHNIGLIQPYIGSNGKQFKNVSTFYYGDEVFKVVGNYMDLERLRNGRITIKGYFNDKQRKEEIEDRT